MIDFKKYLFITYSSLYTGLDKNWLTAKEAAVLANRNQETLNADQETLLSINVNDDDKAAMLEILKKKIRTTDDVGIRAWQLAYLTAIHQSQFTVREKLREVELQWSRFDYPETWRNFIYYMPNDKVSTEPGLYQNLLTFLNTETKKLSDRNNQ